MNEYDQSKSISTTKSREELLAAKLEELSPAERYLQGLLKDYPELTIGGSDRVRQFTPIKKQHSL